MTTDLQSERLDALSALLCSKGTTDEQLTHWFSTMTEEANGS